ncbi:hypothetical protein HWI79_1641 [Cryptosporidium felis]|nr:hypothetical protein HWI79_1641 [Cryptosporidium felis]
MWKSSATLTIQKNSIMVNKLECSNNIEIELNTNKLISTVGKYRCIYPIVIRNYSNIGLYSWSPEKSNKCLYIHLKIMNELNNKENGLFYDISRSKSCRNIASIDSRNCRILEKANSNGYKMILTSQIKGYKLIYTRLTLKIKVIIGILFHILLFTLWVIAARNRKSHKMTIRIFSDKKTESININSTKEVTTHNQMTETSYEKKAKLRSEEIWELQPSTNEGMLDGFIHIHEIDIDNSIYFIETLKKQLGMGRNDMFEYGVDAGCGIGRTTPTLMKYCKKMDLSEPVLRHLKVAVKDNPTCCEIIHSTLQQFNPSFERYDFIWIQWALQYLSDDEFVQLLIRIRNSFGERQKENRKRVVCIKDNTDLHENEIDPTDGSIIRTEATFREIFERANYKCLLRMEQTFLPTTFKPIITFAIAPCT